MRPRVFPAEDLLVGLLGLVVESASMRPRVFPAEDDDGIRHGVFVFALQ